MTDVLRRRGNLDIDVHIGRTPGEHKGRDQAGVPLWRDGKDFQQSPDASREAEESLSPIPQREPTSLLL